MTLATHAVVGGAVTVIVAVPACVCEHKLASCTDNKLYSKVFAVAVGAATVTELPDVVVTVVVVPPLMLYEKIYGLVPAAPVKVILGEVPFWHTEVVPDIVAVGLALTKTSAVGAAAVTVEKVEPLTSKE